MVSFCVVCVCVCGRGFLNKKLWSCTKEIGSTKEEIIIPFYLAKN